MYTATDLCPASISRLQRRQDIGCTDSFLSFFGLRPICRLLSATRPPHHKYEERFPSAFESSCGTGQLVWDGRISPVPTSAARRGFPQSPSKTPTIQFPLDIPTSHMLHLVTLQ
jgi:hypothetical protein